MTENTTNPGYEEKYNRLEEITKKLGNGNLKVDELSSIVKEGYLLINECKSLLRDISFDVERIININKEEK